MVSVRIDRTEPFADGRSFGSAGAYERVIGVARGEIDPNDPRNAGIVNIEKAACNGAGFLEYEADVFMLRPVDPQRRNGKVLYEFLNRGRKLLLTWVNEAPETATGPNSNPRTVIDAGTGFLLRDGWTLVWSGWDGTIGGGRDLMGIRLPVATEAGAPIEKLTREEFALAAAVDLTASAPRFKLTYEAANVASAGARLTMRYTARGEPMLLSPEMWAYEDAATIVLRPEAGPFDPAALYELHYVAKNPIVLGIGFAAVRDVIAWLRFEQVDAVRSVLGLGISLSGRFAREFLELGMNVDHQARRLFDGMLMYIAGAGKTFVNYEFGQPGRTRSQHGDHDFPENWFPFSCDSICRGDELDPYIFAVNSSSEYWQKAASLIHTDPRGAFDREMPSNVRTYLIAGTQHAAVPSQQSGTGPCAWPRNPQSVSPLLRAMVVALDEWVSAGTVPPPSAVPRISERTLVPASELTFPHIGPKSPAQANPVRACVDWVNPSGYEESDDPYKVLVPALDADGNEVAGIRLPDVAVPLGTYTGWNFFASPRAAAELCNHAGLYLPFARTEAEKDAALDPRPALPERYRDGKYYVERIRDACTSLVQQRFLLAEDVPRYLARAEAVVM
jgi:hypothetical protein